MQLDFPRNLKKTFNKPKFGRENVENTLLYRQVRKKIVSLLKNPKQQQRIYPPQNFTSFLEGFLDDFQKACILESICLFITYSFIDFCCFITCYFFML